jgi:hypothetical protein
MAYTNHLLFNNVFLKNLRPSDEELTSASYLVHESARDWYPKDGFSTVNEMVENWLKPLLNVQSLDIVNAKHEDENAWLIVAPWEIDTPLALCYTAPPKTDLSGFREDNTLPKGQHWMIKAVNIARQYQDGDIRWVILTNGNQWRLLDSLSLRRYEAYLEVDLYDLLQGEDDPMAAYLFHRLFRLENSLERDEKTGENKLNDFLDRSNKATENTEKYLKTSVSDNLSIPGDNDGIMAQLCMGFVNAVDPSGKKTFADR